MQLFEKIFIQGPTRVVGKIVERIRFTKPPILIVACPRSGTTLLLSILSSVPSIFTVKEETSGLYRWAKRWNKWIPERVDKIYREIVFRKIPKGATRWLEKTPRHINRLDKILNYFNNRVKVIHIIRDGRDVTLSTHPYLSVRDNKKYWVDPERWAAEVKFGLSYRSHPCVYTLKYEDLIFNFEGEMKKLFDFLDEPFTDQIKNWIHHTQIKQSKHWHNEATEVHSASIQKWKKPEHQEQYNRFMNNKEAVELLRELAYLNE